MLFGFITQLFSGKAQKSEYDKYPVYNGNDLGVTYSAKQSVFKVWAPSADGMNLWIYESGSWAYGSENGNYRIYQMNKAEGGAWSFTVEGDWEGRYYTFQATIGGRQMEETVDPYARAVGVNGKRGMIVDLNKTNPVGWQKDKSPVFKNPTDAIIYELHVRDAGMDKNSGIIHKGKFLGLTEKGTKNDEGLATGLDHLIESGITHVHLLPCFDFNSVDESKPGKPQYNWGYDPLNYNVPEGSYATNAGDGLSRIREFKQLVKTFHENGLRVVMDVVYNHTALTENSNFNQLVPGYYYRQTKEGKFSNATACGNETASERPMMRKFILESMKYWIEEYHVDGFRIDLMGVHDIETMNLISKELHTIRPDILLYGEGWTAGSSPLPDSLRALKKYAYKLDRIAVFSDDIRDGIKGSVFDHKDKGFVSGKPGMEESIKFGIVASVKHPQVDYSKVNYSKAPYAKQPYQTVTYAECHDNHVLWDKLTISAKDATEKERKAMYKLALSIVLTSQGISFLHAGTEFLRSKKGVENSFESPDSINAIDWSLKTKNRDVVEYVRALIKLKKEHPAFRMMTAKQITDNIRFRSDMPPGVIAYTINGKSNGDTWKVIQVFFNGTGSTQSIVISKNWRAAILNNLFPDDPGDFLSRINLGPYACTVLYQQ